MTECSLVIRAFNEEQHIGRLLEGVRHQSVADVEIILVDSGSSDATVAIAGRYGARVVSIAPEQFTFGRSLNLGMATATRPLVVIASAHVHPVYPDWLEQLLATFVDPEVALAYGKQRGNGESKFSERQVLARWFPDQANLRQRHPFCNNANAAIRRALWETHPYDETLTGLEDLAWAKWACEQGHLLAYLPEAEVVHVHSESRRGVMNRYRREGMAFKTIFPEAHFSAYDLVRNVVASIGFDCLHAFRQRAGWNHVTSIFWFRWAQFWGTYQGYRRSGLITPELRQTFYYHVGWEKSAPAGRDVDPIRYNE